MSGVITDVTSTTRGTSGQAEMVREAMKLASRLSGRKTMKMTTICFHRGGATGAALSDSTEAGSSNHPSMPVRRSRRRSSTLPCAASSHHSRCGEASHEARESVSEKR